MNSFSRRRPVLPFLLTLLLAGSACSGSTESRGSTGARPSSGNVMTAEDIDNFPSASSVAQLLATMPGVVVTGAGVQIVGRGGPPLFVVDGIPTADPSGGLSVNPRDIARIEVVTDAAELAAYGVRGGNGVIRIDTR